MTAEELAQRRDALHQQIELDRVELAESGRQVKRVVHVLGIVQRQARFLRRNLVYVALPAAVLLVARPRMTLRLLAAAWAGWHAFQVTPGPLEARVLRVTDLFLSQRRVG